MLNGFQTLCVTQHFKIQWCIIYAGMGDGVYSNVTIIILNAFVERHNVTYVQNTVGAKTYTILTLQYIEDH